MSMNIGFNPQRGTAQRLGFSGEYLKAGSNTSTPTPALYDNELLSRLNKAIRREDGHRIEVNSGIAPQVYLHSPEDRLTALSVVDRGKQNEPTLVFSKRNLLESSSQIRIRQGNSKPKIWNMVVSSLAALRKHTTEMTIAAGETLSNLNEKLAKIR